MISDAFQTQVYTDENGLKVIVEYRDNDDGKKVKVLTLPK